MPLFTMQDPLCFQTIIRVERRRVTIENTSSNLRELKMGRCHFYMLKKKRKEDIKMRRSHRRSSGGSLAAAIWRRAVTSRYVAPLKLFTG